MVYPSPSPLTPPQHLKHSGCAHAEANKINDAGQIVGLYTEPDGTQHSFVGAFDPTTQYFVSTTIGELGGRCSSANDINVFDVVVGTASRTGCILNGYVYVPERSTQNLNDLIDPRNGWLIEMANILQFHRPLRFADGQPRPSFHPARVPRPAGPDNSRAYSTGQLAC